MEPTAEANSAQLSDASETKPDLEASAEWANAANAAEEDESRTIQSDKVLEPAGVAAAASSAKSKTARAGRTGRAPKGAPTAKRDRQVKPERTSRLSSSDNRSVSSGRSFTQLGSSSSTISS